MKNSRLVAIGDIHGCSTALKTLLRTISPQSGDTIVTLGDHVDWGPDSKGVIEQLLELDQVCRRISLLGNHEIMMIDALNDPSQVQNWIACGGEPTALSYGDRWQWDDLPESHQEFLKACRKYHETETAIFVHANYAPNRPMNEQGSNDLFWMFLEPEEATPHYNGKTVFCGHTPQTSGEILDLGFLVCLDTDCSRNGWLTALEVNSGEIWQSNQDGATRTSKRKSSNPRRGY